MHTRSITTNTQHQRSILWKSSRALCRAHSGLQPSRPHSSYGWRSQPSKANVPLSSTDAARQREEVILNVIERCYSTEVDQSILQANVDLLESMFSTPGSLHQAVHSLLERNPSLLVDESLTLWRDFLLYGYGAPVDSFKKVIVEFPEVLHSNIYSAGCVLMFFKQHGFSNSDITKRIIGYYPYLLGKQVERDFLPVLDYLAQVGCTGHHLRLLIWEYPRIFSKDYRRQVKKFQYLGVYGLSLQKSQLQR